MGVLRILYPWARSRRKEFTRRSHQEQDSRARRTPQNKQGREESRFQTRRKETSTHFRTRDLHPRLRIGIPVQNFLVLLLLLWYLFDIDIGERPAWEAHFVGRNFEAAKIVGRRRRGLSRKR